MIDRDTRNADAFNWLAYATRSSGDAAGSLPIYEKALAIDPRHRGAPEYIREDAEAAGALTVPSTQR